MDNSSLKVITVTYEVEAGKFVYRLFGSEKGFAIRRVPHDVIVWSHCIISQIFMDGRFKPAHQCSKFDYFLLDDALKLITFTTLAEK